MPPIRTLPQAKEVIKQQKDQLKVQKRAIDKMVRVHTKYVQTMKTLMETVAANNYHTLMSKGKIDEEAQTSARTIQANQVRLPRALSPAEGILPDFDVRLVGPIALGM